MGIVARVCPRTQFIHWIPVLEELATFQSFLARQMHCSSLTIQHLHIVMIIQLTPMTFTCVSSSASPLPAYHFWAQIVFTGFIHGNHIGSIWVVTSFIFLHRIQQLSSLSSMSSSSSLSVNLTVISILSPVKGPSITLCFHMHTVCKEEELERYRNSSSFNSASSFALHKWFYFCFQH